MHLFSALSPDICKIVGKTQINCLIRKHKIVFPVERIRFNMAWTPCTATRSIRLVPLLTRKPMKCQVHRRTPAVLYCSTKRTRGKRCLMDCHPGVRDAGSAQPSRPVLWTRRRVRAEGRTPGSQLCPYRVTNSEHARRGCSQAASEIHLAAKWERCFRPKLTADVKFHTRCKNTCSSRDFFYRSLTLYTFKIHSEWIPIIQSNKWALYACWGKQKKIWGLRYITSPE